MAIDWLSGMDPTRSGIQAPAGSGMGLQSPLGPLGGVPEFTPTAQQSRIQEENDKYKRNFLERLFAPFGAPQQTVFAFTRSQRDGFQFRDVSAALGHGLKFANPWSNEEAIDPEEVRRTLFGENHNRWSRGATNIAISLLFDPLLFAPMLKGLKVVEEGGTLARAMTAVSKGTRSAVTSTLSNISRRVIGNEQTEELGIQLGKLFISKYYGLPEEMKTAIQSFDQNVQLWRNEAFRIFRKAKKLGGDPVNQLLTKAMETEAIGRAFREGGKSALQNTMEWRILVNQAGDMGASPELFTEIYMRSRNLDNSIGEQLVQFGLLDQSEYLATRDDHLRRIYQAYENPRAYLKRITSLDIAPVIGPRMRTVQKGKGTSKALFEELRPFRRDFDKLLQSASKVSGPDLDSAVQTAAIEAADRATSIGTGYDKLNDLIREAASNPTFKAQLEDAMSRNRVSPLVDDFDTRLAAAQAPATGDQNLDALIRSVAKEPENRLDALFNQARIDANNPVSDAGLDVAFRTEKRKASGKIPRLTQAGMRENDTFIQDLLTVLKEENWNRDDPRVQINALKSLFIPKELPFRIQPSTKAPDLDTLLLQNVANPVDKDIRFGQLMDEAFGVPNLDTLIEKYNAAREAAPDLNTLFRQEAKAQTSSEPEDLQTLFAGASTTPKPVADLDAIIKDQQAAQRVFDFMKNSLESLKTNRYIVPTKNGASRFDMRGFSKDLGEWMNTNYSATADELLDHVKNTMLAGFEVEPEIMETIANTVMETTDFDVVRQGSQYYADKVRSLIDKPGITWRRTKERLELIAERENIPEDVRKELGEITAFAPRIATEASEVGRLLETKRFTDNIFGVTRDETGNILSIEGSAVIKKSRDEIQGAVHEIDGARFGYAGETFYAKPVVGKFLESMEGVAYSPNETRKIWEKVGDALFYATGIFKTFKVVMDPAAHARNFLGNLVLADLAGVNVLNARNLKDTYQELSNWSRTGDMTGYLKMAEEAGVTIFQNTFSQTELAQIGHNLKFGRLNQPGGDYEGIRRIFNIVGQKYVRAQDTGVRYMSDMFNLEEQFAKLLVFRDRYDSLARQVARRGTEITPDIQKNLALQAGELADKAIFNYGDVPLLVDFARKYGIMPFITFPYKAGGRVAETLITAPYRVLKYPRLADQVNYAYDPEQSQVDAEIASLPEYARNRMVVRMPFDDKDGRAQYLDLSYIAPWYALLDVVDSFKAKGEDYAAIPRDGMFTPPFMAVYNIFARNEDGLGRKIVSPSMTRGQAIDAMGKALLASVLPPSIPFGSRAASVSRALNGLITDSPEPIQAASVLSQVLSPGQEGGLNRYRQRPQSQAQLGGGGLFPVQDPNAAAILGTLAAFSGVGSTIAADPAQQQLVELGAGQARVSDLHMELSRIKNNANLSTEEKRKRMLVVIRKITEATGQTRSTVQAMRR